MGDVHKVSEIMYNIYNTNERFGEYFLEKR